MTDLLPCPFCGNDAALVRASNSLNNYLFVQCLNNDCVCESDFYTTEADAIAAWNRRAPTVPDEVREAISHLEAFSTTMIFMVNGGNTPDDDPYKKYVQTVRTWLDALPSQGASDG